MCLLKMIYKRTESVESLLLQQVVLQTENDPIVYSIVSDPQKLNRICDAGTSPGSKKTLVRDTEVHHTVQ